LIRRTPYQTQHTQVTASFTIKSIPIKMDVCVNVCVCMLEHISGTPGAISTKLGTHIAICMCKNLMYILYIFRREDGVGGREFG
jgi:hypothetical protein